MKLRALLGACALATSAAGSATPVLWTLNNAVFSDGGVATGNFVWDADAQTFGAYDIFVSGGTNSAFPSAEYSNALEYESPIYKDRDVDGTRYIYYTFVLPQFEPVYGNARSVRIPVVTALTDAGGTVALQTGSPFGGECYNCNPWRAFKSGYLTGEPAPAVPEPASWAMLTGGLGLAGAAMRRRSARAVLKTA